MLAGLILEKVTNYERKEETFKSLEGNTYCS